MNNQPQTANTSRLGRYIVLEFAHQNSANDQPLGQPGQGSKPSMQGNNGKTGNDAPRRSNRKLPDLTLEVKQVNPIRAFDGTEYPSTEFIASTATQEPDIAQFKQYSYTDSAVGATIPYNLYLPANYDASKQEKVIPGHWLVEQEHCQRVKDYSGTDINSYRLDNANLVFTELHTISIYRMVVINLKDRTK